MSIFLTVCKFVLPFLAGAISAAFHKARIKEHELLEKQIHNERLRTILLHLDEVVASVVKELAQTLVEGFKLASNGKLTPESRAVLRSQALSRVREYLGAHGLEELGSLLKLAEGALMNFIESKIEANVHDVKQLGGAATSQPDVRLPAPALS